MVSSWEFKNGGFRSHGGINGWFIMEHPNRKWMMTGGSPISGNHQMAPFFVFFLISE